MENNSQIINNVDKDGHSRILLRENTDEYLKEIALANNPPSGTKYTQNGKGIELIYSKL